MLAGCGDEKTHYTYENSSACFKKIGKTQVVGNDSSSAGQAVRISADGGKTYDVLFLPSGSKAKSYVKQLDVTTGVLHTKGNTIVYGHQTGTGAAVGRRRPEAGGEVPGVAEILDKALEGERISDDEAVTLLESKELVRDRQGCGRASRQTHRPEPDHVHHRPQRQLHERLRHRLRLLRLLPPAGRPREGYLLPEVGHLQEGRGDPGARRHRCAHAGRPPPRPRHRLLRGPLPLAQGALPDPPARALAARDPAHRASLEADASPPRSRGSATRGSTRSPAAAPRSSSTASARSSRRRRRRPPTGSRVMRHAHRLGMSTTATMMYGHVETLAERVEHMRRIRDLQDETARLPRLHLLDVPARGTRLAPLVTHHPTSFEYLLTQAVSRIYLDNVDHIQSSWVTQGMKVGQVALEFGADDLGSVMIEENVVSAAGTTHRASTDDFIHAIKALARRPCSATRCIATSASGTSKHSDSVKPLAVADPSNKAFQGLMRKVFVRLGILVLGASRRVRRGSLRHPARLACSPGTTRSSAPSFPSPLRTRARRPSRRSPLTARTISLRGRTPWAPDIYAGRLSASGEPLDGSGFVVASGPGNLLVAPAVAYGGANYLVAWTDCFHSWEVDHCYLYAARVSRTGEVLDPNAIAITGSASYTDRQGGRVRRNELPRGLEPRWRGVSTPRVSARTASCSILSASPSGPVRADTCRRQSPSTGPTISWRGSYRAAGDRDVVATQRAPRRHRSRSVRNPGRDDCRRTRKTAGRVRRGPVPRRLAGRPYGFRRRLRQARDGMGRTSSIQPASRSRHRDRGLRRSSHSRIPTTWLSGRTGGTEASTSTALASPAMEPSSIRRASSSRT